MIWKLKTQNLLRNGTQVKTMDVYHLIFYRIPIKKLGGNVRMVTNGKRLFQVEMPDEDAMHVMIRKGIVANKNEFMELYMLILVIKLTCKKNPAAARFFLLCYTFSSAFAFANSR